MGLFDFFKGKGAASGDAQEKTLMRHAERVLDKRAMSPDRFASIEYLCRLGTEEAWRALLPSLQLHRRPERSPTARRRQFILDRPCRARRRRRRGAGEGVSPQDHRGELGHQDAARAGAGGGVRRRAGLDDPSRTRAPTYQKNPERKIQAIVALEEALDPRIAAALLGFLDDVSEDVRFHAVRTLLAQGDARGRRRARSPRCSVARSPCASRPPSPTGSSQRRRGRCGEDRAREGPWRCCPRLPTGPYAMDAQGIITRRG
jgi:hypothetical protein